MTASSSDQNPPKKYRRWHTHGDNHQEKELQKKAEQNGKTVRSWKKQEEVEKKWEETGRNRKKRKETPFPSTSSHFQPFKQLPAIPAISSHFQTFPAIISHL
jgi:hypothetical protein